MGNEVVASCDHLIFRSRLKMPSPHVLQIEEETKALAAKLEVQCAENEQLQNAIRKSIRKWGYVED